jgi:outer membrane protein assembly factor BamB
VSAKGTPFPSGEIRWKYSTATSATSLAPPALHLGGVLAPSNDNYVHGMARGPAGGTWPSGWASANLGSPAQARSPIVTLGGVPRMYLTTFDGWVHAIDARSGAKLWDTRIGTAVFTGGGPAPAGIFTAYGGAWDYILVGTRQSSGSRFYALDPYTGVVIDYYPQAGDPWELGAVTGMATVDYELGQVYFATFSSSPTQDRTLWCLKLGPPSDALQFEWAHQKDDNTPVNGVLGLGNIDGSPTLRGERLYVGNTSGVLWSIDRRTGDILGSYPTSSGNIKSFPFVDRGGIDVYFTTTSGPYNVWAVKDQGTGSPLTSALSLKWRMISVNPSVPLLTTLSGVAGLYVGTDDVAGPTKPGILGFNLNTGTSARGWVLEDGTYTVGAPSFDSQYKMIHVGSSKGVFYAVDLLF